MSWLAFSAIAKRFLGWLTSRPVWQLLLAAALLFGGIQTVRLKAEQRHSAKVGAQLAKATEQLRAISSKRDEQKTVTRERIKVVNHRIQVADARAKAVESAPPAPDCKTNQQVLDADI